ncbi:MAG TPA: D-alanyl-lipoteichoic acid biosynthesis protein DltD [Chthoniobacteraceae bacterium]|nr:D-alanyl-lipoteichoic acid biosynthesis protein DltD [Chthoniobacteraceae bacterium]
MRDAPPIRPHLRALAYALLAAALILAAGAAAGEHLVHRRVNALAPMLFPLKNQGVVLQQNAFARPDLLPFYGSSELVKPIPDKAAEFFRSYPTDFEVFPVGKAGTTSIIILEKLAAVGETLRGKKVAISLSPSWFMEPQIPPHYYEGNFSKLQAHELVFRSRLSRELKRDIARRMLEFPATLTKRPLLAFALRRLAGGSKMDRVLFAAAWPFGWADAVMLRAQDEFESAAFIWQQGRLKEPHRLPQEFDWETVLLKAASKVDPDELRASEPGGDWQVRPSKGDAEFLANLKLAHEWQDLELLLRTLRETGARPLILTMPLDVPFYRRLGVSKVARSQFLVRLRALTQRYEVPLLDFAEHNRDPRFLADHHDHLSIEGWMYYNRALDDFFHNRIASSQALR